MAESTATKVEKRNVMLPVDGSDHGERAFNFYMDNIKRDGDYLLLVNVIEPVYSTMSYGLAAQSPGFVEEYSQIMEQNIAEGKILGHKYIERCKAAQLDHKFILHIGSKAGEHIVEFAKDNNINLVVMGNRGLGKLRRTFLGSVSDYVVHHAHIPVCIVPPKKDHA